MFASNVKFALMAAVAGVASSGATAAADTVSYNATSVISLTPTNFDSPGSGVGTLSFPKFALPNAQLTKVTLSLLGNMDATATVTPTTAANFVEYQARVFLFAQDPAGTLTVPGGGSLASITNPQFVLTVNADLGSIPANTGKNTGLLQKSGSSEISYTSAATIGQFWDGAPGDVIMTVGALSLNSLSMSGGGITNISQTIRAAMGGTVTYEYYAVPEATTLILGGLAMMPIVLHRRRARQTA